ncbi:MAG: transglycosylase domain-containing protein [Bacteroidetes bacterium]|jgi:penicillin-binding protein 1A|nr:transglycosylase domain-containing protein [Bacteroidota bacterium]
MAMLTHVTTRTHQWVKDKKPFWRWVIYVSSSAIALFLLFFFFLFAGVFGAIPNRADLSNLEALQASDVYDRNGAVLGKLFEVNRSYVPFKSLPTHLVQALLATEDERFYKHRGVDFRALGRVLVKGVLGGQQAGGGSTISQQLIKNTFGRRQKRSFGLVIEKLKELVAARRLERLYDKDKILELYLNTVPFGENIYGIDAASDRFFSKAPEKLQIEESAVLVGLLKANTTYNPRLHPDASRGRRNIVFGQMARNGYLEEAEHNKLCALPLEIDYNLASLSNHQPHYLLAIARETEKLLEGKTKRDGKPYDVRNDGLRIYSTIDQSLQRAAEQAMHTHIALLQRQLEGDWGRARPWGNEPGLLQQAISQSARYKYLKKKGLDLDQIAKIFGKPVPMAMYYADRPRLVRSSPLDSIKHLLFQLKAGFLAVENHSGAVLTWVGSPNYEHFKFDYLRARRQVASTFKPIVYAAALEAGYKPCQYFRNDQIAYSDYNWQPDNYNNTYGGKYSMAGALAQSVNTVAVDLLYKAKKEQVIELAAKLGIENPIPALPSIALGVADLSLLELVKAYSTMANEGMNVPMRLIDKIEDKNGETLYQAVWEEGIRAMDQDHARIMVELLRAVVDRGTAVKLRKEYRLNNDLAGKTGTSQGYSDGWFVGFTPTMTAGVWVGADQPSIHFRSSRYGQGAHMALPIFALWMQTLNKDTAANRYTRQMFAPLEPDLAEMLDCEDFVEDSGIEKFFNNMRDKNMSDDRIERRNRRKKILRSIFEFLE